MRCKYTSFLRYAIFLLDIFFELVVNELRDFRSSLYIAFLLIS